MHFLDYKRDADQPAGTVPVETEREFLRLALSTAPLLVRGKSLCAWADTFWRERDIPFTTCASFEEEVSACCDALTQASAHQIVQNHNEALRRLARPLKPLAILDAVFPADIWHQPPSLHHAARWVVWLYTANPAEYFLPLLRGQAASWRQTCQDSLKPLYGADSPQASSALLRSWLRIATPYLNVAGKAFPLDVPIALSNEALQQWRGVVINTKGSFFEDLCNEPMPAQLMALCADLCFDYFVHNPALLAERLLRKLRAHLPDEKTETLRRILRPQTPGAFPDDIPQLLTWFVDSYLPYREWSILAQSQSDIARTQDLGKAFALFFLGRYPQLVMSQEPLISFQKASDLRGRNTNDVTIYIILDGLNVPDSIILLKHILSHTRRLTVLQNELCFAPLPTITEVCKQALKRGYTPRIAAADTKQEPANVTVLAEKKDPDAALGSAQPGDLFIWSIMEPDETYHSKGYDRDTLKRVVASRLESVAERVINAALAVPDDKRVRLIITTDHGRLLNTSARTLATPAGMRSHQRAALGKASVQFPPNGIFVEESTSIAFLNSDRFHLTQDSAVVLTEDSFFMEDGRGGTELFPHGGAFPEEVIIPWIELGKDAELPSVVCTIEGEAQEGTKGALRIAIQNRSNMAIKALSLSAALGPTHQAQVPINQPVAPWTNLDITWPVEAWPSTADLGNASAHLRLQKPDGDAFVIIPTLALKAHGFQSRTAILDDLL